MKKWFLVLLAAVAVTTASVYVIIPSTLRVSKILVITCPKNAANRFLLDETKWAAWWPGADTSAPVTTHRYNGRVFTTSKFFTDKIALNVATGNNIVESAIHILPLNRDSIQLTWQFDMAAGFSPFQRIRRYQQAKAIRNDLSGILDALGAFLQNTTNLYGFPIKEIIAKDSALVTLRRVYTRLPDNITIYRLIDTLKNYVASQGALQTNNPMLKLSALSSGQYQVMVAIPTNRMLPANATIMNQHFVPWKTLVAEVTGGRTAIDSAFRQMEKYVEDHQRTSMAIPFESVITNRVASPDSLNWKTLVCQPVS